MNTKHIPVALNSAVAWLQAHWVIHIALLIGYALFILLAHHAFVQHSIWVMNALTLPVYNAVVAGISGIVAVFFLLLMRSFLEAKSPERPRQLFYLFAILALLVGHHIVLFEMNIEVIHAMQFAVLGFLLFTFTQRFGAAIAMGIPVMMLDEWYQYQVLYPDYVQYFDFNDILMDILGCALLLCGMWIVGVQTKPAPPIYRRPEIILIAALSVATVAAVYSCTIAFFPENDCPNTWLILNKLPNPMQFWQTHPYTGRTYHAMPPAEGIAVVLGGALFFLGMGRTEKRN